MMLYSRQKKYHVAVDCIIFGYDTLEKEVKLLLIKRSFEPAKGKWSLAGGFVEPDESLDLAASRVLENLTGLKKVYMKQSYCYGNPDRDPGARVISSAYWALIKLKDIDKMLSVRNGAHWFSLEQLPELIFDHNKMVVRALKELQMQVMIKPVGFELLPQKFTLVQLLDLYEAINQRSVDKRNFRKKLLSMNILEKLDEKERETSKKGAFYYKFNKERYLKLKEKGFDFDMDVN